MNKKRKIVIASLLKPVDETRMFEKMAVSLDQTNKYAVNIIGFSSKNIPTHPTISFHPLFNFKRLSFSRLLSPLRYWHKLLQLKPELIIVNTYDLLIVSCVYGIIFGVPIVYDVQENYKQNIIWSSDLPRPLRYLLAKSVRSIEQLFNRMIIHFFAAEKCYLNECSFINGDVTILENKAKKPSFQEPNRQWPLAKGDPIRLVYTGTIAESYGIFDCIALADSLIAQYPRLQLRITGYCPRKDTLIKLEALIRDKPYISLTGGAEPVPHPQILRELEKAHFALISYRLNPSNQDCFPTRIWECLAYKVPMLMKREHPWCYLLDEYGAGLALDFYASRNPALMEQVFYQQKDIPDHFYWEWEAKKLLQALESLF